MLNIYKSEEILKKKTNLFHKLNGKRLSSMALEAFLKLNMCHSRFICFWRRF